MTVPGRNLLAGTADRFVELCLEFASTDVCNGGAGTQHVLFSCGGYNFFAGGGTGKSIAVPAAVNSNGRQTESLTPPAGLCDGMWHYLAMTSSSATGKRNVRAMSRRAFFDRRAITPRAPEEIDRPRLASYPTSR